ncbi:argininosuccinate lyase [Buchnera aphidicola (Thelaxes californica)]|uniref:Argininosuccinate lyase n=1 Tax=Buchnera aphidicola (Thelaxes californica) TaxID=1315998 RepID=A0A4D6YKZ5_9GAMM|nr:argininosuccinate lyase [Buchnera aphidicola]QCI26600.1 argininosuccinate lyase [Buchnera aphidicola (Thelaxes californica)]
MNLWGGRFSNSTNKLFEEFNKSIHFDYILAKEDIISSIMWSKTLKKRNIITLEEQIKIEKTLTIILTSVKKNINKIALSNSEDIHSWVEKKIVEKLGILGKKLHTGRSRNEQVTTDLKLWCRFQVKELIKIIYTFKKKLIKKAEKNIDIIMPGYTHLQRAQPIRFSHWCLAYYEMLTRDVYRLKDSLIRLNTCPLGSGALAGNSWSIDRFQLSKNLDFINPTNNSLDSVSDRDYVVEILSNASISMSHLSRFAEDLIFFNSGEANYVTFSDSITSGSSLMPQKKNPDILEIIRSKCGRVYGSLISILVVLKGLPLAYNKDLQEDKEGLFDAIKTWKDCLIMSTLVIKKVQVNDKVCYQSAKKSYSNATELANYLVSKGIAFRDAHHITGKIVLKAIEKKLSLDNLDLKIFQKFCPLIQKDVFHYISIKNSIEKYKSHGGTSKEQVLIAIYNAKKQIL